MKCERATKHSVSPTAAHGEESVKAFEAFIGRNSYPCLGAKSALSRDALQFFCADDIRTSNHDRRITERVQLFASKADHDDVFLSLVVMFPGSPSMSEIEFERALWQRLQAAHVIDRMQHAWDGSVSDDPASSHFSMSVGGRGFFVIGLHPRASRASRRFQCPVMVFNLHSQFEQLRTDGRYEKLSQSIVARDVMFSGSRNPMLAKHGQRSEARQYSGRVVDEDWVCPLSRKKKDSIE